MPQNAAMRRKWLAVAIAFTAALAAPGLARADESIIKNPGDHPAYRFEAEPHGLIGFGGPFAHGRGELGAGFRGAAVDPR